MQCVRKCFQILGDGVVLGNLLSCTRILLLANSARKWKVFQIGELESSSESPHSFHTKNLWATNWWFRWMALFLAMITTKLHSLDVRQHDVWLTGSISNGPERLPTNHTKCTTHSYFWFPCFLYHHHLPSFTKLPRCPRALQSWTHRCHGHLQVGAIPLDVLAYKTIPVTFYPWGWLYHLTQRNGIGRVFLAIDVLSHQRLRFVPLGWIPNSSWSWLDYATNFDQRCLVVDINQFVLAVPVLMWRPV